MTSIERSFTAFSIGVSPGDRNRTRSRKGTKSDSLADVTNGDPAEHVNGTIIDLTDRKWQFGTTAQADSEIPPASDDSSPAPAVPQEPVDSAPQRVPDLSGLPLAPVQQSPLLLASSLPSLLSPPIQPMPPSLIPPPFAVPRVDASLSPLDVESSRGNNEWEVQDFGFGFGHASGTGYAVVLTREQMDARERERVREREVDRERIEAQREVEKDMENMGFRDPEFSGRPRRGSYNGGTFYDRGGRRGGRGFSRGGRRGGDRFQNQSSRFSVTPPQTFQALGPIADQSGFYPQAPPAPYMVPGFEGYQTSPTQAPVPVPVTQPSFPLDSMRWFLLGQLEYYLSPQNMAQDFFLRQQMDARGWISIPLLASFNRVKRLAADVSLVRDVLVLSAIAEVRDDWVRMRGWEQFVLPDAAQSVVEEGFGHYAMHEQDHTETEDEDEEEVEFVMGREAALWTPERRS